MSDFLTQSRSAFRRAYGLSGQSAFEPEDSADCLALARKHRVLGLWVDAFPLLGASWKSAAYGQALHSARMVDESARINEVLAGEIDSLRMIKGPVLAQQAWPQFGLRSYDDLDFCCPKDALIPLVCNLSALGYKVKATSYAHRDHLWHYGWGLQFLHSDGFLVEANHRLFPAHFPWPKRLGPLTSDDWSPIALDHGVASGPTPALHLLYCCAHAAWHGWERLAWLVDISGLLVKHPASLELAKSLAGSNPFLKNSLQAGVQFAVDLFGPLDGVELAKGDYSFDSARKVLSGESKTILRNELQDMHRQLMSRSQWVGSSVRRIATPGDLDFRAVALPPSCRGFYWLLRPLRQLKR